MPQPTVQPMVHVEDLYRRLLLRALGAQLQQGRADGDFAVLRVGGSELSLLGHLPDPEQNEGQVELNFEVSGGLTELKAGLSAAGVRVVAPTTDTGFGRQLRLESPGGLPVKVDGFAR